MSFSFRFKSLLKLRRHRVASEKQKLHNLLQKELSIQDEIDNLESSISKFEQQADQQQQINLNSIKNYYKYIHNKQHALLELYNELYAAKESINKQQQTLIEASRSVKVLEKLESREKLKYYKILQEKERKQLNEIGTLMYNRANPTWI